MKWLLIVPLALLVAAVIFGFLWWLVLILLALWLLDWLLAKIMEFKDAWEIYG